MRKIFISISLALTLGFAISCETDIFNNGLTNDEIIAGLKEALKVGTDTTTYQLHKQDGYFTNTLIKILLPSELNSVKTELADLPFGVGTPLLNEFDDLEVGLNRAAEDAAEKAKPIFWDAITSITISDGLSILHGDSIAATRYLRTKTEQALNVTYKPKIDSSMEKLGVKTTWYDITSNYNTLAANPIYPLSQDTLNTDITSYCTEKALNGLFVIVGQEETKIRKNPLKRISDILKKVFGTLD